MFHHVAVMDCFWSARFCGGLSRFCAGGFLSTDPDRGDFRLFLFLIEEGIAAIGGKSPCGVLEGDAEVDG